MSTSNQEPRVLSRYHVAPLFAARARGEPRAETSLDLGLSRTTVELAEQGVVLLEEGLISWDDLAEIQADDKCFLVERGGIRRIHAFSEAFNRPYSLLATPAAPTLINAGFTMHRVVGIDPMEDTRRKIESVAPIRGRVLDTNTGLGYTATLAATTAEEVVTIEIDPAVLDMAELNPWSRELFRNPRIRQIVGDSFDEIRAFDERSFDRIIHDPPSFSLAGELYSREFYGELLRVLRRNGKLFHYIGDLESNHGRRVARGVIRRLKEAGFTRVVPRSEAFGLVAAP